jgi:hypothetical protein
LKLFYIIYCVGNSHKLIADFRVLLTAAPEAVPEVLGSNDRNYEGYILYAK